MIAGVFDINIRFPYKEGIEDGRETFEGHQEGQAAGSKPTNGKTSTKAEQAEEVGERRFCWRCALRTARKLNSDEFQGLPEPTKRAMDAGHVEIWFCDPCKTYLTDPRA